MTHHLIRGFESLWFILPGRVTRPPRVSRERFVRVLQRETKQTRFPTRIGIVDFRPLAGALRLFAFFQSQFVQQGIWRFCLSSCYSPQSRHIDLLLWLLRALSCPLPDLRVFTLHRSTSKSRSPARSGVPSDGPSQLSGRIRNLLTRCPCCTGLFVSCHSCKRVVWFKIAFSAPTHKYLAEQCI